MLYWGLRKYKIQDLVWGDGWKGQLGLEPSPELYVQHIVEVFREVKRVLRPDGILWLNMGDSYWGGKGQSGQGSSEYQEARQDVSLNKPHDQIGGPGLTRPSDGKHSYLKPLDLCQMPFKVADALQRDGWYLRSTIIWQKANPMPESVAGWRWERHKVKAGNRGRGKEVFRAEIGGQDHAPDGSFQSDAIWQDCPGCPKCACNDGLVLRKGAGRPTSSFEYIFMLTKSPHYFYNSVEAREYGTENVQQMSKVIANNGILPLWGTLQGLPTRSATITLSQSKGKGISGEVGKNGQGEGKQASLCQDREGEVSSTEILEIGEGQVHKQKIPDVREGAEAANRISAQIQGKSYRENKGIQSGSESDIKGESQTEEVLLFSRGKNPKENKGQEIQTQPSRVSSSPSFKRETAQIDSRSEEYADSPGMADDSKEPTSEMSLLQGEETFDDGSSNSFEQRRESRGEECCGGLSLMQCQEEQQSSPGVHSRNLRDVWSFPTAPYKGAHFATFPEELVKRCLKASTSEAGVCAECEMPYAPIVDNASGGSIGHAWLDHGYDAERGNFKTESSEGYKAPKVFGYRPCCQCKSGKTVPALVLDPFAGSGTVMLVASKMGLRSVGYELSEEYCKLAVERNKQMALEVMKLGV